MYLLEGCSDLDGSGGARNGICWRFGGGFGQNGYLEGGRDAACFHVIFN